MSKILVIQPHRMLRQAIALFLFPAHEVQTTEAVPESLSVNDFDAVIIDAASLQETKGTGAQAMRAVQGWKVPTIWIESDESFQTPERDKLVIVKRPIAREALASSLVKCLGVPTAAKRNGTAAAQHRGKAATEKEDITSDVAPNAAVIELVDVVEEDPGQKTINSQQKKK